MSDLNEHLLKWFLNELGIKMKIHKASEFEFKGVKSDLVLDMCKKLGASTYIFGELGKTGVFQVLFNNSLVILKGRFVLWQKPQKIK